MLHLVRQFGSEPKATKFAVENQMDKVKHISDEEGEEMYKEVLPGKKFKNSLLQFCLSILSQVWRDYIN